MKLDKRETATVLAALRTWQILGFGNSDRPPFADILDTGDCEPPLDESEIDDLCERINFD